jgi:hypothetical protein
LHLIIPQLSLVGVASLSEPAHSLLELSAMRHLLLFTLLLPFSAWGQESPTSFASTKSKDTRLASPRTLNSYFPFTPPETKEAWESRREELRNHLKVALGLWPEPEKTPLKPVVHGKIERDGYTVEKVYFASMPGHYVTGNLYRPTSKVEGKRPAVLCPHGHWENGRLYEASEANGQKEIAGKGEKTIEGARYPLQARCVQLARMGCVVFFYDMVGYADSKAISHREGFADVQAELRSQNWMGLQTWNSIRALDFVASLADVDAERIGVTGASGGGTQTFILCALDDRPKVAFPAVMVSTAMQGGCVCENCSYLRVGTGNVELAAMFAPKPLGMSGANDWTREIETKGFPELKKLYALYGAEANVLARCWPEFGHNYNQVSREFMYSWMNKHLLGGDGAVAEQAFKPIPPKELVVFGGAHPRPKDELDVKALRQQLTESAEKQWKSLEPKDEKSLAEFRRIARTGLKGMIGEQLPAPGQLEVREGPKEVKLPDGITMHLAIFGRKGQQDAVPAAGLYGPKADGSVILWVHPGGKASLFEKGVLRPEVKQLLDRGKTIVAMDTLLTGELAGKPLAIDKKFAGYTFGYNRPLFAQRVHDILTMTLFVRDMLKSKNITLVGLEGAGPWAAAAGALSPDTFKRVAIDAHQFRFENIASAEDENFLPGIVKLGGLPALLALNAPSEMLIYNHQGTHTGQLTKAAYDAVGKGNSLKRSPEGMKLDEVAKWLAP